MEEEEEKRREEVGKKCYGERKKMGKYVLHWYDGHIRKLRILRVCISAYMVVHQISAQTGCYRPGRNNQVSLDPFALMIM